MVRIESLLSARLYHAPQLVGWRITFVSNISGRLSLHAMDYGGSIPEPLLPPSAALQNPKLLQMSHAIPYCVLPRLDEIVVMMDRDGDELYQPMVVPLEGGVPEPAFGEFFEGRSVLCSRRVDLDHNVLYFQAESREEAMSTVYQAQLETRSLIRLGHSPWGRQLAGVNADHTKAVLIDEHTVGDRVLYLWSKGIDEPRLIHGTPLEERALGQVVAPNAISHVQFTPEDLGLLFVTALFDDCYGLGYLNLRYPEAAIPVTLYGRVHSGVGELVALEHLTDRRYLLEYNIDGCSWLYEGAFDEAALEMDLQRVICGQGILSGGVLDGWSHDRSSDRTVVTFSTDNMPVQIYTVEGEGRQTVVPHTRERFLGVASGSLSEGEDVTYESFDGLVIPARLYRPAPSLGLEGPFPLVYYIHGGPWSQARPDFTWFSMPLIQLLTLRGFAVFVPNVRGSTGYGISYSKRVDRDWGGQDRLDHVEAMRMLSGREGLDLGRAGVVGRSYGGYMTLTLASRHPGLWRAAVDMFGPWDLLSFLEGIPESWKPFTAASVGDIDRDREHLIERSPRTHIEGLRCPLLVIQGRNDPRVVEGESRSLVERLRSLGRRVEYLLFEDEGHDVLKMENRVACYNRIVEFLEGRLKGA